MREHPVEITARSCQFLRQRQKNVPPFGSPGGKSAMKPVSDIRTLTGPIEPDSLGKAINDNGQIIGTAGMSGFLYSGGAFHALPTLPGGTYIFGRRQ